MRTFTARPAIRLILFALFMAAVWLLSSNKHPAPAQELAGRVVHVADGDTLTLLATGGQRYRIRLAWIDAPELAQAFGHEAKEALDGKVYSRDVKVQVVDVDPYGRSVGLVRLGDRDINAEMVAEGWAWHYRHYNNSPELEALEQAARERHIGLWADEHPLPPWEFRQLAPEREKRRERQRDGRSISFGLPLRAGRPAGSRAS